MFCITKIELAHWPSEMQTALSKIWTWVAVSISYCDNHYTTSMFSIILLIYLLHLLSNTWQSLLFISAFLNLFLKDPKIIK